MKGEVTSGGAEDGEVRKTPNTQRRTSNVEACFALSVIGSQLSGKSRIHRQEKLAA